MFLGFGDGLDGDLDGGDSLGLLSLRSVTGFLGGFGWGGGLALENGAPPIVAIVVGTVVGGSLLLLVAGAIRFLYSLRESGNLDYRNAVGKVGTVYLPIPPAGQGPGRIWVELQGRMTEIAAYTHHGKRIPAQHRVRVLDMVDERTVLVGPLSLGNGTEE
jgi:hypothetical protein